MIYFLEVNLRFGEWAGRAADSTWLLPNELGSWVRFFKMARNVLGTLMRITIDLPDQLVRELKALAERRGTSLKELMRLAIEQEIRKAGKRVTFPLLSSDEPGSLSLSNAESDDLLFLT